MRGGIGTMALFASFAMVAFMILILVFLTAYYLLFGFLPREEAQDACAALYSSSAPDFLDIVGYIIHFITNLMAVFLYYKFIMFLTLIREKLLFGAVFYVVLVVSSLATVYFTAGECDVDYFRLIFGSFSYYSAVDVVLFILPPFIVGVLYKKNAL